MNALLCGTGHNLRKIHRKLRPFYALRGFKISIDNAVTGSYQACTDYRVPYSFTIIDRPMVKFENGVC